MPSLLRFALLGAGVFLAQWGVFGRLGILGAHADVVLLFVAWMGLRYGRRHGLVAGFLLGLLLDAAYDTWGVHTFVKSLVGFLVGLFPASERETLLIQPQQAFGGGLAVALVHNGLLVIFYALDAGARGLPLVLADWLGAAVYTAFAALLASLFLSR